MAYPTAVLTLAPYGGASRTTTLPSVIDILLGPVTYHPVTTTDYGYPYNDGGPTTTTCLSDSISNLDLSIPDGYGDPTRTTLLSNSRSDGIWTQDDQGSNTAVTTSRLSGTITKNNTIMVNLSFPSIKKSLAFGARFGGGGHISAKGWLRKVDLYKSQSTIFAPGVSVGSPEPFPPRLSSNARLIMGISLGSLVQIVLLVVLIL